MAQRERLSRGAVSEPVPRPAGGQPTPPRPRQTVETHHDASVSWESHFQSISRLQQQELLALADRQGLLYAHQLPSIPNGNGTDPHRGVLPRLLAGETDHLEPVRPSLIAWVDSELDDAQREAVR